MQMVYGKFTDSSPRHSRENAIVRGPRVLRDEDTGDVTTIVERKADAIVGARAPRCLIFHTDRGFIRLWNYFGELERPQRSGAAGAHRAEPALTKRLGSVSASEQLITDCTDRTDRTSHFRSFV